MNKHRARRQESGARLLASVCLLLLVSCWPAPFCGPAEAQQQANNRALMHNWEQEKQHVKDQVVSKLRRQGQLPRDGSVEFSARIKKDPAADGGYTVVIDHLRIYQNPPAKAMGNENPSSFPGDSFTRPVEVPGRVLGHIDLDDGRVEHVECIPAGEYTGGGEAFNRELERRGNDGGAGHPVSKAEGQASPTVTERKGQALPVTQPKSWWRRLFGF